MINNIQEALKEMNPFLREVAQSLKTRNKFIGIEQKRKLLIDRDTGEQDQDYVKKVFLQEETYDPRGFIKLFDYHKIVQLSKAGQLILGYIIDECLEKDRDYISLIPKNCQLYLEARGEGLSTASIYRGITDLIDNRFIAKSEYVTSKYFINIGILFNGKLTNLLKRLETLNGD